MTGVVVALAGKWQTSPFKILQSDIDDFILLCNYEVDNREPEPEQTYGPAPRGKEQRIRVNDATATGGWF